MEGTMSTIMLFAGTFAPSGWLFCNGQLLSIAEYDALFSLIGTTYGGDGQVNFALPNLCGRVPVGTGTGAGLSPVALGEAAGSEMVTVSQSQMPAHTHTVLPKVGVFTGNNDGNPSPSGRVLATSQLYTNPSNNTGTYLGGANAPLAPTGGNQPISILKPYLALNYVICVEGIYPSRP
jgi:microcystin-dependent protein